MKAEPCPMPDAVIESVFNAHARECACCAERRGSGCQHPDVRKAHQILRDMKWGMGYYYFWLGTLYVGVELDGYMHT